MCLGNGCRQNESLIKTSQHSSPSGNIWRRQNCCDVFNQTLILTAPIHCSVKTTSIRCVCLCLRRCSRWSLTCWSLTSSCDRRTVQTSGRTSISAVWRRRWFHRERRSRSIRRGTCRYVSRWADVLQAESGPVFTKHLQDKVTHTSPV